VNIEIKHVSHFLLLYYDLFFFKLNSYLQTIPWLILSQPSRHPTQTAIERSVCKGKVNICFLPITNFSLRPHYFFQSKSSPITSAVISSLHSESETPPAPLNTNNNGKQGTGQVRIYVHSIFTFFSAAH
jgi:hypothetical protein